MPASLTSEGKTLKAIQRIHSLALNPKTNFSELGQGFLKIGLDLFDMQLGIISQIEEKTYSVFKVNQNQFNVKEKDIYDLGDTLCSAVYEKRKTIIHTDIGHDESMKRHPAYEVNKLESYLGTPIWHGSKVFGTLNFSSLKTKEIVTTLELQVFETMAFFLTKQLEKDFKNNINRLFLRNLAHEMRAPLNGILGFTELMTDSSLDQEQFEMIDMISRSAKGLEEIINDLSTFIKADRENNQAKNTNFNVSQCVNNALLNLQEKSQSKDVFIKSKISEDLFVNFSKSLFHSTLTYILKDCLNRRRERKEILINFSQDQDYFHLFISDNGPTLTKDVILLLNTFGRLEYNQVGIGLQGLSLDLSMSSILIQLSGGHLRVQNKDQGKLEFNLAFPKVN